MNRQPVLRAFVLFALTSTSLAACSTQGTGTAPGDSVLVEGAQHVVWKKLDNGFGPPIPATAPCHLDASYDFDLGAGSLSWSVCTVTGDSSNPASYSTTTGSRLLTTAERTQATDDARAVKVSGRTSCGADKPTLNLEVDTSSSSALYGDDFYACDKQYQHYVISSALDQLGQTLSSMAHNP
jgi:hypothetical protein